MTEPSSEVIEAVSQLDWELVRNRAQAVLAFEPDNSDAADLLNAADRAIGSSATSISPPIPEQGQTQEAELRPTEPQPHPCPRRTGAAAAPTHSVNATPAYILAARVAL